MDVDVFARQLQNMKINTVISVPILFLVGLREVLGKILREVYEQCNKMIRHHKQAFLAVDGTGHASMMLLGL